MFCGDLVVFSRRGNVENQYNLDLKLTKTMLKFFFSDKNTQFKA